jgi:hypothetical protein
VLLATDRPRRHHYEFAHKLLPKVTMRPGVDLTSLVTKGALVPALLHSWDVLGRELNEEDRLPPDGLTAELIGGTLLITLPRAEHAAEAHFVAVAPCEPEQARRFYTLEHSWGFDDQPETVLGEWHAGSHYNLGPGPVATRSGFLAALTGG